MPQPLQLTDVLAQLPLDVVQQSCFDHLGSVGDLQNLKLVSKACAQLVRQHASVIHLYGGEELKHLQEAELSAQVRTLNLYSSALELNIQIECSTDVGIMTVCGQEEINLLHPPAEPCPIQN